MSDNKDEKYVRGMSSRLKPGNTVFKDFLSKLTPEQKKEFWDTRTAKRRARKMERSIEKDMEILLRNKKYEIMSKLLSGVDKMLEKAIEEDDVQAWTAVWDRVKGKSNQNISVDGNMDTVVTTKVLRYDGNNSEDED